MFAANLTLGLYVSFGPKSLTRNSTVGLESVPLGGTEQTLVTPTSYITLVPLLATMLFIMGGCGSDPARAWSLGGRAVPWVTREWGTTLPGGLGQVGRGLSEARGGSCHPA